MKKEIPRINPGLNLNEQGQELGGGAPVSVSLAKKPELSLEAIVAKSVRQLLGDQSPKRPVDVDELDVDDNDLPPTPYEYVEDEDIGREVTRAEKAWLDAKRAEFDNIIKRRQHDLKSQAVDRTRSKVSSTDSVAKKNSGADKGNSSAESTAEE